MTIHIEKKPYQGWENALHITTDVLELWIPLDVGIRILHGGLRGRENLFGQIENQLGKTGSDAWLVYGGHRLWHAPEEEPRTYTRDNFAIDYEVTPQGVRLVQATDAAGISRCVELVLDPTRAKVQVKHTLRNEGAWDVTLAPWALTVMRQSGIAIVPLGLNTGHSAETLTPKSTLALWGYTRLNDPRMTLGGKYILLQQDPANTRPNKIGLYNTQEWSAYWWGGMLFAKRARVIAPVASYPDNGSTFEIYVDHNVLELETLAPLTALAPKQSATHVEEWLILDNIARPKDDDGVDATILPLLDF